MTAVGDELGQPRRRPRARRRARPRQRRRSRPLAAASGRPAARRRRGSAPAFPALAIRNRGPRSARPATASRTRSASSGRKDGRDLMRRVPVARGRVVGPVDLAQIVEHRQRRGRGEVGIGKPRAGQPVARAGQPVGVFQVLADIGTRRADDAPNSGEPPPCALGIMRLQHALAHQMAGHVGLGLVEIPVDEAADFGPFHRVFGHQPALAHQRPARLVDIFGDHRRPHDRRVALGQQHRQRRRPG